MNESEKRFEAKALQTELDTDYFKSRIGEDGFNKMLAILLILKVGGKQSVAYQKAILAATETAIERTSCPID